MHLLLVVMYCQINIFELESLCVCYWGSWCFTYLMSLRLFEYRESML